jgi:hypothetical protein
MSGPFSESSVQGRDVENYNNLVFVGKNICVKIPSLSSLFLSHLFCRVTVFVNESQIPNFKNSSCLLVLKSK